MSKKTTERLLRRVEQQVAAERQLRDGDTARRTWLHPGPDGRLHKEQWTPRMGPWDLLAAKIDAAEDTAHGYPHRREDGSLATLPELMAEIEQLMHTASNDNGEDD